MAKSLAGKAAETTRMIESNPGAGLPALYQPAAGAVMEPIAPLYQRTPYVQFISTKGSAYGKCLPFIPDLSEGDPVLILPDPQAPKKLTPYRFYLVYNWQHFSEVDNTGYVARAVLDVEQARGDKSLTEHVETVVLVANGDTVTPARCTFKGTKVNAVHHAIAAVAAAGTAEWGALSADHRATLAIPDPRFRVATTVSLKASTSRSSGFKYVAASGKPAPTTVGDWEALSRCMQNTAWQEMYRATVQSWETRIAEIQLVVE